MQKPAWFAFGGRVVSPAATLQVVDWWDAWRLMWMAIGTAVDGSAILWRQ